MTTPEKIAALLCGAVNTYEKPEQYFKIEKMVSEYLESVYGYCATCGGPKDFHRPGVIIPTISCGEVKDGYPRPDVIMERHQKITRVDLTYEENKFFCEMIANILSGNESND